MRLTGCPMTMPAKVDFHGSTDGPLPRKCRTKVSRMSQPGCASVPFPPTWSAPPAGHAYCQQASGTLKTVSMDLACSEQELEQLLTETAFSRNFAFKLNSIGDGE